MVEIQPIMSALFRFLRSKELNTGINDQDLGYGMHAWLKAAFDSSAPQPWRVCVRQGQISRVLGYCQHDGRSLQKRLYESAHPSAFEVCSDPEARIASKPMPSFETGRQLAFEVLCCPVGRKARTGVEKDLFLMKADKQLEKETLSRETVYCNWAAEKLKRDAGSEVKDIELSGFQLVRQLRQTQRKGNVRRRGSLTRPQALLRGRLTVTDPNLFTDFLARGLGRHRAFGYGMMLVRPPQQ